MRKRSSDSLDIKVLVVSHKNYRMPKDKIYMPIQVGNASETFEGCLRDNTGDNIAVDNPRLCELTAIYWAWRNLKADYIGLTHYRRHFTEKSRIQRFGRDKFDCILTESELKNELKEDVVIVPNKRKYYIETMESHFIHLPYTFEKDYRVLRQVMSELSPEYMSSYEKVMNRTWAHMFNMFIMKWEWFDEFCSFMFPIIFECDKRIDTTGYSFAETRAVAYFGEFMIDIWMEKNGIRYKELDVMFMEKQNWIKKGGSFVMRRFGLL